MAKKISRHQQKTKEEQWWHQTSIKPNRYTGTKDTEMQAAVVRSCEADEQQEITSKSTGNIGIGYKKLGATKQGVDWQHQRGFTAKRKWYVTGSRVCQRQEAVTAVEEIGPCNFIVGNLQVKTDKKKGENTNVYLYFVLNICKLCNVSNYNWLAVTPTKTLVCHRNAKLAIRIMSWSLLVMLIQSNVCCCACYTGEYCFEVKAEPNSDDVTEHPHDDKPRPYVFSF